MPANTSIDGDLHPEACPRCGSAGLHGANPCARCGWSAGVPSAAGTVEAEPAQATPASEPTPASIPAYGAPPGTTSGPAAWNPVAIGWISLFFSFLPAGIIYALNYPRLGYPKKQTPFLVIVTVGFVIFLGLGAVVGDRGRGLFFGLNLLIAVALSVGQKDLFQRHLARGGRRRPSPCRCSFR